MLKRILIFGILASVIQIVMYSLLLKLIQLIQLIFIKDKELISDFNISLSIAILFVIILTQNILTSIINKNWFNWFALGIVIFIYIIGWGENLSSWPISTTIFLLVGFLVLFSKPIIDKKLIS
jgi:hypothetical protein